MTTTSPMPSEQALAFMETRTERRPFWEIETAELRRQYAEDSARFCGRAEAVARVEHVDAGGVPARLYRPVPGDLDVLVWLHGGAWICGDLHTEDALARALANRARCAVLLVDYRRVPEHRFPAAFDDAWSALWWAADRFAGVAVGGDSAGGNLAAAVALRAREEGLALALQMLVYPMLDYRIDAPSYEAYAERYREFAGATGFGAACREGIRRVWEGYVDAERYADPYVAPLQAASLEGLAPALIVNAEHDILCAEGEDYGARLAEAGVPVDVVTFEGQIHGFFRMLGLMADAHDAVDRAGAAVRAAFAERAALR